MWLLNLTTCELAFSIYFSLYFKTTLSDIRRDKHDYAI